jgi:outer membrane lipoprotein SlyB
MKKHVFNRTWFFGISQKALVASAVIAALTGCASNPLTATKFSGSSNLSPETMQSATVIKTMPIKIKHNSQVTQNAGIGAGAGGIAGYLLGGSAIAAIAGAVGGGAIGDVVTPSTIRGTDIFVKFASGQMMSIPEVGIVHFAPGEAVYVMTSAHGHYRVEPANQPAPVAAPTAKAKS